MITLRKITLENRRELFRLEVNKEQQRYVASNLSATKYRTTMRRMIGKMRINKNFGVRFTDKKGKTKTRLFYNEGFARKPLQENAAVDVIPKR